MVTESPKPNAPRAQQFLNSWSMLIGPEYARLLLPIRRAMLVGFAILLIGLPVEVFVASIIPNISFSVGEVVVIMLIVLSATPLVVSGVQFIRLEVRIQRDLEAAGHTVRPGGPDLRSIGIFESWSKRSGISAQDIIATGRVVLGEKLIDLDLGCDAADRGDHPAAIAFFTAAVDRGAEWVGLNLGNSYAAIGDVPNALVAFERAWRSGKEPDAGFNLAQKLNEVGRAEDSRTILRELADEGYSKAMEQEAWNLRIQDRAIANAELLMLRAANNDGPDGDRAAGTVGSWMWEDRQDLRAEPLLERGVGLHDEARTALAEVLQRTGRVGDAERLLQEGFALSEADSMIPYATMLEKHGQLAKSEEVLRAGSDQGDSHAAYNLYVLLSKQDRPHDALNYLKLAAQRGDDRAIETIAKGGS